MIVRQEKTPMSPVSKLLSRVVLMGLAAAILAACQYADANSRYPDDDRFYDGPGHNRGYN